MKPNFEPLRARLKQKYDVQESSVRGVTEGVWYADRNTSAGGLDIANGVWWTHSGSHIVSLAHGTSLHAWGGYDWECYVFKGEPCYEDDICCHSSFEAAEQCALHFIATGYYCGGRESEAVG